MFLDFFVHQYYICKKNRLKHSFFNNRAAFFLPAILLFFSCNLPGTFEKNVEISGHAWSYINQPEIKFNVTDTVSTYNVFVSLRHTDAYAYKNIWLYISTQQPGDSTFHKDRFEFTLQNQNGEWLGTGMSDIWEVRCPLFTNIRFTRLGTYTIRLQQTMRDNPLMHVMNAGIRIEKAN